MARSPQAFGVHADAAIVTRVVCGSRDGGRKMVAGLITAAANPLVFAKPETAKRHEPAGICVFVGLVLAAAG